MDDDPTLPDLEGALGRAQAWLGDDYAVARDVPVPNPSAGLWLVSYTGRDGALLDDALLAVTADDVRPATTTPGSEDWVGAQWPDDEEYDDEVVEPAEEVDEDAEMAALVRTFGAGEFGPPGQEFDETVCIMAIPAEDDPVHGIGPEDKHATLLYFGDRSKSADPDRIEGSKALFLDVLKIAAEEVAPFTAKVVGVEPLGDNDPPAQVWLLDSPDLQRLFDEIPEIDSEIASMYEDADATRYPEYKPHVTIGYGGPEVGTDEATEEGLVSDDNLDEARQVTEIRFDRISLWWGEEHHDFDLGTAEFDALVAHFSEDDAEAAALLDHLGFDPSQPRAADGRWDPSGGGGGAKKAPKKAPAREKAKEERPRSTQEKVKALVEGILKALDDVIGDLSAPQAKALIEQIKHNAQAFIKGQERSGGGGGGHGGGGKKGAKKAAPGKGKAPADGKGKGKDPADDGVAAAPGTVQAVINSVTRLLNAYAKDMRPGPRAKLERSVKALHDLK